MAGPLFIEKVTDHASLNKRLHRSGQAMDSEKKRKKTGMKKVKVGKKGKKSAPPNDRSD